MRIKNNYFQYVTLGGDDFSIVIIIRNLRNFFLKYRDKNHEYKKHIANNSPPSFFNAGK